jgi:hypothetical protein
MFNRRDFYITARSAAAYRLAGDLELACAEDREIERLYRLAKHEGVNEDDLVGLEERARAEAAR